jgi:hypothetical protein
LTSLLSHPYLASSFDIVSICRSIFSIAADTVSVVVGGSYHPIAVDFNGIIRLSNALTSVEERLSNLLQESSRSTGKQDGRVVPDHMGWIVTMWHFGVDGLTEYAGEKFSCTWEVGQNALIRAYTKDFRSGKTHIRLERQEYPRKSLACAIEEKLNKCKNTAAAVLQK